MAAQAQAVAGAEARLQTIPGVGRIVALTLIAALADVTRFPSAKHVASYAGLVPSTNQSGDRDRHGHITKRGATELRAMVCEAAQHARRPSHPAILLAANDAKTYTDPCTSAKMKFSRMVQWNLCEV